jgi:hypothetical protein
MQICLLTWLKILVVSLYRAFGQTEILTGLTPDQVKATRGKIAVTFPGLYSQLTSLQRFLQWSVSGARTRTISPFFGSHNS